MQTADCRLRVKRRLGAKCRMRNVDVLNICALYSPNSYSLSQNCWDTFVSPCPLNVGVQGLVTEPR